MNDLPMTVLGFISIDDVLKESKVALAIRIIVCVVGAVLGWFVSAPIWAILHRIVFRKAIDGLLYAFLRLVSAFAVAAVIFLFLPIGFGDGFGFGPGPGGIPGAGPGSGKGDIKTGSKNGKDADNSPDSKSKSGKGIDVIDIKVLGGEQVTEAGKYYLIERKGKEPLSLDEVEAYLKPRKDKANARIVLTSKGDNASVAGDPQTRLKQRLTQIYGKPPDIHSE